MLFLRGNKGAILLFAALILSCPWLGVARASGVVAQSCPIPSNQASPRVQALVSALKARLEQLLNVDIPKGKKITSRDIVNGALTELVLGYSPNQVQDLLSMVLVKQNLDSSSKAYGTFPWYVNSDEIVTDNATDFATQALGPIVLHYGGCFSTAFKRELNQHIEAALVAIENRYATLPVNYTNMFVTNFVNQILLGKAVGDVAAMQSGFSHYSTWVKQVAAAGVPFEYNSPEYTLVQQNSLMMAQSFAPNPSIVPGIPHVPSFKDTLDLYWTFYKALYFSGDGSSAGPNSRSYDFVRHQAGLYESFYLEGLRDKPFLKAEGAIVDLEKIFMVENDYSPKPYHPNLAALPGSNDPLQSRIVMYRNYNKAQHDIYTWITSDFALGSASVSYDKQDANITLHYRLPGNSSPPVTSIITDSHNSPYGITKVVGLDGFPKPVHEIMNPVSLQKEGDLWAAFDLDPTQAGVFESYATNILLPKPTGNDFILVGDQPMNLHSPIQIELDEVGTLIRARFGSTCAAFRFSGVDSLKLDSNRVISPKLSLVSDHDGNSLGVVRLVLDHYRNPGHPVKAITTHLRMGLLLLAESCTNEAQTQAFLRRAVKIQLPKPTIEDGRWVARALYPNKTELVIRRDLNNYFGHERLHGKPSYLMSDASMKFGVNYSDFTAFLPFYRQY